MNDLRMIHSHSTYVAPGICIMVNCIQCVFRPFVGLLDGKVDEPLHLPAASVSHVFKHMSSSNFCFYIQFKVRTTSCENSAHGFHNMYILGTIVLRTCKVVWNIYQIYIILGKIFTNANILS